MPSMQKVCQLIWQLPKNITPYLALHMSDSTTSEWLPYTENRSRSHSMIQNLSVVPFDQFLHVAVILWHSCAIVLATRALYVKLHDIRMASYTKKLLQILFVKYLSSLLTSFCLLQSQLRNRARHKGFIC
jgi:hypothetical protein